MSDCFLNGFPHDCGGPKLDKHHLINRSKLRGNPEARKLVEGKWSHLFIQDVCANVNRNRIADTKAAQAFMFSKLVDVWGWDYVSSALDEVRAAFKCKVMELRLEAISSSAIQGACPQ